MKFGGFKRIAVVYSYAVCCSTDPFLRFSRITW